MLRTSGTICLAILLAACGKKKEEGGGGAAHTHAETGPNGGEILELGSGEYHLEILHDHVGGKLTVWVLGGDMKQSIPVPAPTVNLVTKGGPVQFTLEAAAPETGGKAEAWTGSHEGLEADPWDGRIRLVIGDKTFQSPLEGAAHEHE